MLKKTACGTPAGAIICFAKNDRTLNKTLFPSLSWGKFKESAIAWKEINGVYGNVFQNVNWKCGAMSYFWHKNCKWKMTNMKTLMQARKKFEREQKEKEEESRDRKSRK